MQSILPMLRTPVSAQLAARIENAETQAWIDMYAAIPDDFRERFAPELLHIDEVVLTRCAAIPFVHFNNVLNLGIDSLATERALDAIIDRYSDYGIAKFTILHNEHCAPMELTQWMQSRSFTVRGEWERIYRPAGAFTAPEPSAAGTVELVSEGTADEWAHFLDVTYGMPTGPWLRAFACRKGWTHAMLRRDGKIVAVRSMFTSDGTWAWLGVEAPVPGWMGPTYDLDYALDYALVRTGIEQGIESFVADIEAPAADQSTPAYDNWAALGFTAPYTRKHYVHG